MSFSYKAGLICFGLIWHTCTYAQELYIHTDPASNIPANSLAIRLNNMLMPMADVHDGMVDRNSYRLSADIMYGLHKNWMIKASGYASNMFQPSFQPEGFSLYTKYRFLSKDDFHKHFRMAAFGKIAWSSNPALMASTVVHQRPDGPHTETVLHGADELNLEGNHSGWQTGVVATQLLHKLALSGTVSYLQRINDTKLLIMPQDAQQALQYSFAAGYLLFPRQYESYDQINLNIYTEFIAQSALDKPVSFLDMAPSLQLIIKSKARIDCSYRFQLGGTMARFNERQWLLRLEYNLLQAFGKK